MRRRHVRYDERYAATARGDIIRRISMLWRGALSTDFAIFVARRPPFTYSVERVLMLPLCGDAHAGGVSL